MSENHLYCTGGYDYFTIGSEGYVYRCGALLYMRDGYLGNIFTDELKIRDDEFQACPYGVCSRICDVHWCKKRLLREGRASEIDVLDKQWYVRKNRPATIIWYPSWICNYHCKYCKLPPECMKEYPSVPRMHRAIKEVAWIKALDHFLNLNGIDGGLLQCSGGEPTLYPGLSTVLMFMIERGFQTCLTTNMSTDVVKILESIPTSSISVNASLHPTEKDFDWNVFEDRVIGLKSAGYDVTVNIVTHPDIVPDIPRYHEFFQRHDIKLSVIPMMGGWSGVEFGSVEDYPLPLRKILEQYVQLNLRKVIR